MTDLEFWNLGAITNYRLTISANDDPDFFEQTGKAEADILNSIIPASSRGTIVDYGCGAGRVSKWMADSFEKVIAFDWSEEMLKLLPKRPNIQPCISLDGVVADVAFSTHVLFHCQHKDLQSQFDALAKCMKDGGDLVVHLPAYEIEVDRDPDQPGGICTVTEERLRSLMVNAGFTPSQIMVSKGQYVIGEEPPMNHWAYHTAYKTKTV